jgi:myosin VI
VGVNLTSSSGMDQGKKVWAPDLKEGFILGEISDFGTDTITVQPLDGSKVPLHPSLDDFFLSFSLYSPVFLTTFFFSFLQTIEAPYDAVYPAEDEDAKPVEDNCELPPFFGPCDADVMLAVCIENVLSVVCL